MQTVVIIEPNMLGRLALTRLLRAADRRSRYVPLASAQDLDNKNQVNATLIVLHVGQSSVLSDWAREQFYIVKLIGVPVAVLGTSECRHEVLSALSLGARGYISTNSRPEVVVSALRIVVAGGEFIPAGALANDTTLNRMHVTAVKPVKNSDDEANPAEYIGLLTARERSVLKRMYEGKRNRQIADAMGISESTAKVHVCKIFRKLNVTNRTQACAAARELVQKARLEQQILPT